MDLTKQNQEILISLKKTQSLVGKIISMVENGDYCVDVMQQNLAAIGLLKSAHQKLFDRHLNSCFKTAMESTNNRKKQQMIDEILKVTRLSSK